MMTSFFVNSVSTWFIVFFKTMHLFLCTYGCSCILEALCTWESGLISPVGPRGPTHVTRHDRDLLSLGHMPYYHCVLLHSLQAYPSVALSLFQGEYKHKSYALG